MLVQTRYSRRKGGRLVPLNNLLPFQEGGKTPVVPEEAVTTDATRQFLMDSGILGSEGVYDPSKLQAVTGHFPVDIPGLGKQFLRDARDINDPFIKEHLETLRGTRKSPFFGKTRSQVREMYLKGLNKQAMGRLSDLERQAGLPENFAKNLLSDPESEFYNPQRMQEIADITQPDETIKADPIFQPRVEQSIEENPTFIPASRPMEGTGGLYRYGAKMKKGCGGKIKMRK